ncbi:MAG: rod shape-determining protein MreD [Clostridia bacterium]|nr:rod shape-determining protein MreD [Clostridia bacterium]
MKKTIINILLFITFIIIYLLQSNLFSWFKIAGVMPNLFVIYILVIGLYSNKVTGVTYGILIGLLLDLFIGKKVGVTAIMLSVVGIIGAIFDKNFSKENRITLIIMVVVSTLVFEVGAYALSYFIYNNYIQIGLFVPMLLIECVYNVLLTIILYPLIQISGNKIEEEYKGDKILTRYF